MLSVSLLIESIMGCRQAVGFDSQWLERLGDNRLSTRSASNVVATLADAASQEDETTAHVLRHSFGTTLVRGGADLVLVADLIGLRVSRYRRPGCPGHGARVTSRRAPQPRRLSQRFAFLAGRSVDEARGSP